MARSPEPTVLVVADDVEHGEPLANSFGQAGYSAQLVLNRLEAIRAFPPSSRALFIWICARRVLGGPETVCILRSLEKNGRRVPILATTLAVDSERDSYLAAGVDRLLTPPLTRDDLRRALVDAAMDATRHPAIGKPPSEQSAARGGLRRSTWRAGAGAAGGDKSLLADLIQFFFEDAYGLIVAMHQAIAGQKWEEARRAAHSLKGLASNFGAAPAVAALQAIESCDRTGETGETGATMNRLAPVADEEALWLAAALGEYWAVHGQEASP